MKKKVVEILKEVLETSDIDINTVQRNCEKWDSLAQLNIASELEDVFKISLEPEDIAKLTSVASIVDILKNK